ncbi:unnamed protein product [Discosporangium mesarthrocarpum]
MSDYEDDFEIGESESEVEHERPESWKPVTIDEVIIEGCIGGGALGIVRKGLYNGRAVALKTLFNCRVDETLMREYMDELNVLSKLNHPNIVKLLGACATPPNLFFVMELCHQSLYTRLHECKGALDTKNIMSMALDVARGMSYLHAHRPPIIHRDLKSPNVLLATEDGPLKLCDFGLVRTRETTAGTPSYMAPELLENRPFNKSVDVYAFGILLWEIFSREVPFLGYEVSDIREAVLSGGRPKVPRGGCPAEIKQLICKSWSQEPEDRPDFGDIMAVFETVLKDLPRSTHSELVDCNFGGDCLDDLLRK